MSESEATCHKERAPNGPPLFENGNIQFRVYHVGWIISGFFAIVATVTSLWLINKHLQWYTNKREQRYIVRLLFMVPIYALISFASFLFWNQSTPLILIRDGYESTVLTSFFYLLLMYLSPDPEEQRAIFRKSGLSRDADREALKTGEKPQKWVWPLGFIKWKPVDGLYFLQLQKWGVLQYCVIRPTTTLAAVILEYAGLYCETSWSPGWGHIYITIIVSISVTIAMYCLIQLYVPVSKDLSPHKPLLKLFAIKAVVFLTFWQATGLSLLASFGLIKDSEFMTAEDINIGIGALLETFEMMLFGFLHVKAFTYKPYRPFHDPKSKDPPPQRTKRLRALGHAMDFRETFRELWAGCVYMWDRMRGREPRPDIGARRMADYEEVHGRRRFPPSSRAGKALTGRSHESKGLGGEKGALIKVDVEEQIEVDGRRDWLGGRDGYGYSLGPIKRERSEGLEAQIQRELASRGFGSDGLPDRKDYSDNLPERRQRSWWRSVYDRLSQSGDPLPLSQSQPQSRPHRRHRSRSRHAQPSPQDRADRRRLLVHDEIDFDDPPPPSLIRSHRAQQDRSTLGITILEEPEQRLEPVRERRSRDGLPVVRTDPIVLSRGQHPTSGLLPGGGPPHSKRPPIATHISRSDSVLGRVFPPSTGQTSSVGHDSISPTSPVREWLPARAISPLQIPLSSVPETSFGMAGARSASNLLTVHLEGLSSPISSEAAEVVHPTSEPAAPEVPPKAGSALHRRESAFHAEHPDTIPLSPKSDSTFITAASHHTAQESAFHSTATTPALFLSDFEPAPTPRQSTHLPPQDGASSPRPPRCSARPETLNIPAPLAPSGPPQSVPGFAHPRNLHRHMTPPTDPSTSYPSPSADPTYHRSRQYSSKSVDARAPRSRHPTNVTPSKYPTPQAVRSDGSPSGQSSRPQHEPHQPDIDPYTKPRIRYG